jgi:hypothetical protein
VAFTLGAGGEVKIAGNTRAAAISEGESPKAVNHDWPFMCAFQQATEPAEFVKGHDGSAPKVADEQFLRLRRKAPGSHHETPRRIDFFQVAAGVTSSGEILGSANDGEDRIPSLATSGCATF